jgi:hypothetical protein
MHRLIHPVLMVHSATVKRHVTEQVHAAREHLLTAAMELIALMIHVMK